MRKRPKETDLQDEGAAILHAIMTALMLAQGRGGLTWLSKKLGMKSPSAMRKRLASPAGAFDPVSLRAALLAVSSKAEHFTTTPESSEIVGRFTVELHKMPDGTITPAWKPTK